MSLKSARLASLFGSFVVRNHHQTGFRLQAMKREKAGITNDRSYSSFKDFRLSTACFPCVVMPNSFI
ncbi:hypothetical protein JTE90_021662 [Oedothorax gibbosus]|uniref:Uncharacterized protein n=1 Tax=Oedothorax gibbosus TaxID=931172 RepID=A0AAV6VRM1_9ARAC|nr:hypothetical protein JTE90_021662 [Oedothorax gibbosus]